VLQAWRNGLGDGSSSTERIARHASPDRDSPSKTPRPTPGRRSCRSIVRARSATRSPPASTRG